MINEQRRGHYRLRATQLTDDVIAEDGKPKGTMWKTT